MQHRLEYLGLRAGARLMNLLPVDWSSALMGKLWQWFAPLNERHERNLDNIKTAFPDRPAAWHKAVIKAHWNNLGRTFVEGLCIEKLARQPERVSILSQDVLGNLQQANQGAVFVSLHMGNWELLALAAREEGLPMAGVYQRASNKLVDQYIRTVRTPLYPGGLHAKKGDAVNSLSRWLASGKPVCMMGDLHYKRGIPVQFFGAPAPSNPFPALLAHRMDVPLIAARSIRRGGAHFDIELVEIEKNDVEDIDARIAA